MTKEYLEKRIKEIEDMKNDDEMAHCSEDDLYEDFIRYVSENGPQELAEKAKIVLKTKEIKFSRWYA